jgi:GDP-4-dehydro-6-deoxy-D-mannose reductase
VRRVLITGCSGFLASFLARELQKLGGHKIYGITDIEACGLNDTAKVYHCDIRNQEALFQIFADIKPDVIYHLAAISNVGFSWRNQALTYEVNVIGSTHLMEAVATCSPDARLILMGSAEVYGANHSRKIKENSPVAIRNPYSLSKMAMEMVADLYINSKKLDVIKVRSFNFTGPGQDRKFVASDFASQIAAIEKGLEKPVIRVGNLSAVRDFSDVRDIARYLVHIANSGETAEIYNLCSGKSYVIKEILDILLKLARRDIKVEVDQQKFRPVDIPILAGDNSLLKKKFGLLPQYKIKDTLADLLQYWRNNGDAG